MNLLHEGASFIEPYMRQYGLLALFVIIYLESLGAPLPGESALVGSSVLASMGELPIVGLFLVVVTAAVMGDNTGYAIGRYGGRPLIVRYGRMVGLTPERLDSIEKVFATKGPIIVVGARFVVILRQLNGLLAGAMSMPWLSFLAANVVGALLWTVVWCLGPYFFGAAIGELGIVEELKSHFER